MICHRSNCIVLGAGLFVTLSLSVLSARAEDKPTVIEIQDIKLTVPADWKQEPPANKLRLAQFKIDPAEGDKEAAEMVVSSFGGGGGGIDANLKRWVNQFATDGRKEAFTVGECDQGKYYLSDLSGTYNKPIGPPIAGKTQPTKGYRSVGVILQASDKGVYFLKLTGPEKTVAGAIKGLRTCIGGNADKEEEYELK